MMMNYNILVLRYFEGADYASIAHEIGVTLEQVHVLRKKLVRRLVTVNDKIR